MKQDQLFVIQADFSPKGSSNRFYCPGCSEILGLFQLYPDLKSKVEIRYVTFDRPRPAIVDLIGAENQGSPVLVLGQESSQKTTTAKIQTSQGNRFINDLREIGIYLSEAYGIGFPYPPSAS